MSTKHNIRGLCRRILAFTLAFALAIPININLSMQQPETVYAAGINVDSASDEIATTVVNSTGGGSSGGNSVIQNGVKSTRTGYLCYLLTKNGEKTPYPAYAFTSPGYDGIGGMWICRDRRGYYSVNSWSNPAPWKVTPWTPLESSGKEIKVKSNEPEIKKWMKDKTLNPSYSNARTFVETWWGKSYGGDALKKFDNDEYVLVIETIMNFQYSEATSDIKLTSDQLNAIETETNNYIYKLVMAKSGVDCVKEYNAAHPGNSQDQLKEGNYNDQIEARGWVMATYKSKYKPEIKRRVKEKVIQKLKDSGATGERKFIGPPLIGTVPNLIAEKANLGTNTPVFDSYLNKVACHAEKIKMNDAGFMAYTGSDDDKLSNAQVNQYGVAMIIVHCNDEITQTTCDEPKQPEAHEAPPESVGKFNIVKNYRTKDETSGTYTDDGCFIKKELAAKITIEEEEEYKVVGWKTSIETDPSEIDSIDWNPPGTAGRRSDTKSGYVELEDPEATLYVLLEKKTEEEKKPEVIDYNYLMTETQISRRIWFSLPDNWGSMKRIQDHTFEWKIEAHTTKCSGHPWSCSGCKNNSCNCTLAAGATCTTDHGKYCPGHTDYCTGWGWKERKLKLSIYNSLKTDAKYKDILSTKYLGVETTVAGLTKHYYRNLGSFDRNSTGAVTYPESGWDSVQVIMRGKDKLTLAKWVNNGEGKQKSTSANDALANLSSAEKVFDNSDKTAKTRIKDKKNYPETFSAKFVQDTVTGTDIQTTYGSTTAGANSGKKCPDNTKYTTMKPLEINNIKVKIEVYSGSEDGGKNNTDCNGSDMAPAGGYIAQYYASGHMVKSGASITFTPYVRMKYDTLASTDNIAYVLGEYDRTITSNDYAELEWWGGAGARENLTLQSSQWSIHAQVKADTSGKGINVLPGGAQYELSIDKPNRRTIVARTYQTILTDNYNSKGKTQVEKTTGADVPSVLTESNAITEHTNYINSVVEGFEHVHIEQYVATDGTEHKDYTSSGDVFSNGRAVHEGGDIAFLHNTSDKKASTESKYYLRQDSSSNLSNEGDLDAVAGSTKTEAYTFRSDIDGKIYMYDSTTDSETVLLQKGQDESALSGKAKEINDKTLIVTKLVDAIERNTGNDASNNWAGDNHWYNETFDGITCLIQSTPITIGLNDPAMRVSILDPKLIPLVTSGNAKNTKSTFFSDCFSSAFRTENYSTEFGGTAGNSSGSTEDAIGTFKSTTIKLFDTENLFSSKAFWIPNVTTQDLH